MPANPSRTQNLEIIKTRLKVRDLPSKIKNDLPAKTIAIFANTPELDSVIQIIIDQNDTIKRFGGRRLDAENKLEKLKFQLAKTGKVLIDPSKSEIIQCFKNLFGKVTEADDPILREIDAISKESALQDLETSEKKVDEAINIAQQYQNKYGSLE